MKTLNTLRRAATTSLKATFTVAALSLPVLALPSLAHAGDYRAAHNGHGDTYSQGNGYSTRKSCNGRENDAKLTGGIIGAVLGGVIGSQVSGNGARTEGSAIGAVLGGLAGAGIGDESVNCRKERTDNYRYNDRNNNRYSGNTYGTSGRVTNGRNNTYRTVYTSPSQGNVYRSDRRHNTGNVNYGYPRGGYNNNQGYYERDRKLAKVQTKLDDVRYRLRDLRTENDRLERKLRRPNRHHDNRWAYNRKIEVCNEIDRLVTKKRRLKKRKYRILNS